MVGRRARGKGLRKQVKPGSCADEGLGSQAMGKSHHRRL